MVPKPGTRPHEQPPGDIPGHKGHVLPGGLPHLQMGGQVNRGQAELGTPKRSLLVVSLGYLATSSLPLTILPPASASHMLPHFPGRRKMPWETKQENGQKITIKKMNQLVSFQTLELIPGFIFSICSLQHFLSDSDDNGSRVKIRF